VGVGYEPLYSLHDCMVVSRGSVGVVGMYASVWVAWVVVFGAAEVTAPTLSVSSRRSWAAAIDKCQAWFDVFGAEVTAVVQDGIPA
jgi:hypothetical protein